MICSQKEEEQVLLLTEGIALSNYSFTKHKTNPKPNKLRNIYLVNYNENIDSLIELENTIKAVYHTRDLINEPFSHLTAQDLSDSAVKTAEKYGMKVKVFNKQQIKKLKSSAMTGAA